MKKGTKVSNSFFFSLFHVLLTISYERVRLSLLPFVQVYALIDLNFGLIEMKKMTKSASFTISDYYHSGQSITQSNCSWVTATGFMISSPETVCFKTSQWEVNYYFCLCFYSSTSIFCDIASFWSAEGISCQQMTEGQ